MSQLTIGIVGAGQLAQLLSHNAYKLGYKVICFNDTKDAPAASNSQIFIGKLSDQNALRDFAKKCDFITVENENIPKTVLEYLSSVAKLHPSIKAITISQDRLLEKNTFKKLNIPTTNFINVQNQDDLKNAAKSISLPAILKTRRMGYDGKGQCSIKATSNLENIWNDYQQDCILEEKIDFEFEVSLIGVRDINNTIYFYPLIKNQHNKGILVKSEFPYIDNDLQTLAENHCTKLLEHTNYVGILVTEFFVKNNKLIANEFAPRVHNSGHLTEEACNCSQFENHLRAISETPIVKPEVLQNTVLFNLIGSIPKIPTELLNNTHIYLYGKTPRAGRKLGHINVFSKDAEKLELLTREMEEYLRAKNL